MLPKLYVYYDMEMPYIKANSHILTPFRRVLVNRLPFASTLRTAIFILYYLLNFVKNSKAAFLNGAALFFVIYSKKIFNFSKKVVAKCRKMVYNIYVEIIKER